MQYTNEKLQHELKNKDKVFFEFKWTEDEEADVHGPYTAEHMLSWQQQKSFTEQVQVRRLQKVSASAATVRCALTRLHNACREAKVRSILLSGWISSSTWTTEHVKV